MDIESAAEHPSGSEIAVIGMSCRFPGAANLDRFWKNLRDGVESVSFLPDEELAPSIVDPADTRAPGYVKAASILDGVDLFDAAFFGYSPKEAEIMDPQHRVFLECAWEALERAGYNAETYDGLIGVYAGANMTSYLLFNLFSNQDLLEEVGFNPTRIGNDKDYLSTRVSY